MSAIATLRPYQNTAIKNVYEALRTYDRVMLQCPTGSGKTHIASAIIEHGLKHGRRIGFCVDRLTLLDQTLDRFVGDGFRIGVVQSGHPLQNPAAPVQIISAQTLARRDRRSWPPIDLAIIDEAHTNYSVYGKMMDAWNRIKYIGLSATPFTRGLGRTWQKLVVGSTTSELISAGYLSKYVAFGPSAPDLVGVRTSNGDWVRSELESRMNVLTGGIVEHYLKHAAGKQAIAFTPTVAYAISLSEAFNAAGVAADYVHGEDEPERRIESLRKYRSGETMVMCNCEVLTKGFDLPQIEVGIIARPTKSLSLHIQMLGRVLRTAPGKEQALILDHAGNIERLGFPDDDLPTELCRREKGASSQDQRAREEPRPWNCPRCHSLVPPATAPCPTCGFMPQRQGREVEHVEGSLRKLAKVGKVEKQAMYSQLLSVAHDRGFKMGWVAHTYRDLFGVWPRGMLDVRAPVTPEIDKFVTSRLIRAAKRKEKQDAV